MADPVVHPGECVHCHTQRFTSFESVKSAHMLQRNVILGTFCAAIYLHFLADTHTYKAQILSSYGRKKGGIGNLLEKENNSFGFDNYY